MFESDRSDFWWVDEKFDRKIHLCYDFKSRYMWGRNMKFVNIFIFGKFFIQSKASASFPNECAKNAEKKFINQVGHAAKMGGTVAGGGVGSVFLPAVRVPFASLGAVGTVALSKLAHKNKKIVYFF